MKYKIGGDINLDISLLVKRAQKGDKEAFSDLIKNTRNDMFKVAMGILKNEEDALDAIQDTILDSYKNIEKLSSSKYFKTWIIKILINNSIKILRKTEKYVKNQEIYINYKEEGFSEIELMDIIDKLPKELKDLVKAYYFEDSSIKEISKEFNIPEGTIKSRLSRSRAFLKNILKAN